MWGCWSRAAASRLGPEPGPLLGAGVAAGQDHLQRHQAVEPHLPGLVDDAHPAPPDLFEDLVPAWVRSREGTVGGVVGRWRSLRAEGRVGGRVEPQPLVDVQEPFEPLPVLGEAGEPLRLRRLLPHLLADDDTRCRSAPGRRPGGRPGRARPGESPPRCTTPRRGAAPEFGAGRAELLLGVIQSGATCGHDSAPDAARGYRAAAAATSGPLALVTRSPRSTGRGPAAGRRPGSPRTSRARPVRSSGRRRRRS